MTTPIDEAERTRRELVSTVKRLRVLATSDPQRGDELADALVQLSSARLAAWDFADAATEAPEAVLMAARILARNGAAGPYTSPTDAARFFTASAVLAAVQCGLGQDEAAGRTLAGVDGWMQQLGRFGLRDHLTPAAVTWSLVARSRALLATDAPRANACADAAAHRLYADHLDTGADHLALTVHLLLADCRWAAGRPDQALASHRLALAAYGRSFATVSGRLRPGVAQVALAPVAALHAPYADRLELSGQPVLAIAVRRAQVARLEELGATAAVIAAARAALARSLARQGRGEEAEAELAEATALDARTAAAPTTTPVPPGPACDWPALTPSEALTPDHVDATAAARIEQDLQAAVFEGVAARLEAEQAESRLRAAAEAAAAERAAEQAQAEQLAAAQAAEARAAAEEREQRQAQRAAERRDAEEAMARAAAEERRRQLAEEHRRSLEVDPAAAQVAATELAAARADLQEAGEDLGARHNAQERLVGLLRPLAVLDPDTHNAELVAGLEALVGLRWRLGDADGSREAAREAKTLAADTAH